MISVIDYGAGNLRSVTNVLEVLDADYRLVCDADGVRSASKIVLPGVGHFGHLARALVELEIKDALIAQISTGVPYLGICLGMQILFSSSQEAPDEQGLNIYEQQVVQFVGTQRVPHMGWNSIDVISSSSLLRDVGDGAYMYFAHSFYCPVIDPTAAVTTYMSPFTAVLEDRNIFGVQFHPEKSGDLGRLIMKNFVSI